MCCFSLARMATKGRWVQPALLGLMTRIWVTMVTVVHCYTAPMILSRAVTRSSPEELLKCPDLWCAPRCPGRAVGTPPVLSAEPSSSLTVLLHRALQTPLAARRPKPLLVMKPAHACDLCSVRIHGRVCAWTNKGHSVLLHGCWEDSTPHTQSQRCP